MRLIVITAGNVFDKEPEAINLLFRNGMERLHVRKPGASYAETKRLVERIDGDFRSRIVLHDHYGLAGSLALGGIHVNGRNDPGNLRLYGERGLSVSCSCHSFEEVAAATGCTGRSSEEIAAVAPVFDYVFLSPVFDSISKAGYKRGFQPEQLERAGREGVINERVIALGGITGGRIPVVCRYGFGGAAVLGALWGTLATDGNMEALQARFDGLRNRCPEEI
jgi:thiamine-phosphate pyrophosphorylase